MEAPSRATTTLEEFRCAIVLPEMISYRGMDEPSRGCNSPEVLEFFSLGHDEDTETTLGEEALGTLKLRVGVIHSGGGDNHLLAEVFVRFGVLTLRDNHDIVTGRQVDSTIYLMADDRITHQEEEINFGRQLSLFFSQRIS